MHVAADLLLPCFEVPLYWQDEQGKLVQQRFRDADFGQVVSNVEGDRPNIMEWRLTDAEIECKKRMMAEYHSQRGTVSSFSPEIERMRLALTTRESFSRAQCRDYMYQERRPRFYHTRHHRLSTKALLNKFAEFEDWHPRSRPSTQ
jgi:hypothetical protein